MTTLFPTRRSSELGGLENGVAAIRRGAIDFIEKPFEAEHLLHLVARATESERLKFEYERLREKAGPADELTGTSAAINNVRATLKRVAGTGSRVLIRSEEHTSELQSLMRISYAVFCLKNKK